VSLGHFASNCGKPFDYGFGVQVALNLPYWHIEGQAGPAVNTELKCRRITGIRCHVNAGWRVPPPPVKFRI